MPSPGSDVPTPRGGRLRRRLLVLAPLAAACDASPSAVPVAEAERFLRLALPPAARDARAAGERGLDTLILLGFDAPAASAEAWADALMDRAQAEPPPPAAALLDPGRSLGWWPREVPPGARLLAAQRGDNRVLRLLLAPLPEGWVRVRLVAFSI